MIANKFRPVGATLVVLALLLLALPISPRLAGAATITTPVQHAYVVKVIDSTSTYTFPDTDQQLLDRVDQVLDRWMTESDNSITSFTRVGGLTTFKTSCADTSTVHTTAWNAATTLFPGVDFSGTSGNHMIVIAPKGCGSGLGQVGRVADGLSSGGKVFVDDDPSKGTQSLLHELGHNFSLQHAHALVCTTSTTCTVSDYGNDYEIMGYTLEKAPPYVPASLDSFERTRLRIAETCEVPSLALAGGQRNVTATYDLFGRGTDQGTRGLQLTDPQTGKTYFLDWRNHTGRDAGAGYGTANYNDGVTVEQIEDIDGMTSSILQPTALASGAPYALTAGKTFTAGGLTVRVDAANSATDVGATAQVSVILTDPSGSNAKPLPNQQGSATISGSAKIGSTLTAVPTNWTGGACYRYQWYDDGVPVAGARSSTFDVGSASDGHTITVVITGQQTGFEALAETSAPVVAGSGVPASTPTTVVPTTVVPTTAVPTTAVPTTVVPTNTSSPPVSVPTSVTVVPVGTPVTSDPPAPASAAAAGSRADRTPSADRTALASTGFNVTAYLLTAFAVLGVGAALFFTGTVTPRRSSARHRQSRPWTLFKGQRAGLDGDERDEIVVDCGDARARVRNPGLW